MRGALLAIVVVLAGCASPGPRQDPCDAMETSFSARLDMPWGNVTGGRLGYVNSSGWPMEDAPGVGSKVTSISWRPERSNGTSPDQFELTWHSIWDQSGTKAHLYASYPRGTSTTVVANDVRTFSAAVGGPADAEGWLTRFLASAHDSDAQGAAMEDYESEDRGLVYLGPTDFALAWEGPDPTQTIVRHLMTMEDWVGLTLAHGSFRVEADAESRLYSDMEPNETVILSVSSAGTVYGEVHAANATHHPSVALNRTLARTGLEIADIEYQEPWPSNWCLREPDNVP